MKRNLKKFILVSIFWILFYVVLMISNKVYAASVIVSSSSIKVGELTTITFSIPNGYVGYNGTINFDSSKLSYVSSSNNGKGGNGTITVADVNTSLGQVDNFSVTFKGISDGTANMSVSLQLSDKDANALSVTGSGSVNVKGEKTENTTDNSSENSNATNTSVSNSTNVQKTKSSNANLKNLGITPNDFTGFKPSVTTYSVTVPNNISQISIYAKKAENNQKISGTGKKDLKEGDNQFKVSVTAEDGTNKTYTLNIKREVAVEEPKQEENKPEEIEENTQEETSTDAVNEEDLADKEKQEIYNQLVNEIGTIPEVGKNYNIYVYIFFVIASVIGIYVVLKTNRKAI